MNNLKRAELEKAAAASTPGDDASGKDEAKLKWVMDRDPELSKLYRETLSVVKADKEEDYNELLRI